MDKKTPFDINVPNFESDIPAYLLKDATEKDQYIMKSLSVLMQKTDWQTEKLVEGAESFEHISQTQKKIEEQMKIANGRTTKNEISIKENNVKIDAIHEELAPVRFLVKWGKNKYVLVGLVVLIFIGIPYISSLNLTFKSFVSIFKALYGV